MEVAVCIAAADKCRLRCVRGRIARGAKRRREAERQLDTGRFGLKSRVFLRTNVSRETFRRLYLPEKRGLLLVCGKALAGGGGVGRQAERLGQALPPPPRGWVSLCLLARGRFPCRFARPSCDGRLSAGGVRGGRWGRVGCRSPSEVTHLEIVTPTGRSTAIMCYESEICNTVKRPSRQRPAAGE